MTLWGLEFKWTGSVFLDNEGRPGNLEGIEEYGRVSAHSLML